MSAGAASALLAELKRPGIELRVHGERLRYRPRAALTPALAERVQAQKWELISLLASEHHEVSAEAPQEGPGFCFAG